MGGDYKAINLEGPIWAEHTYLVLLETVSGALISYDLWKSDTDRCTHVPLHLLRSAPFLEIASSTSFSSIETKSGATCPKYGMASKYPAQKPPDHSSGRF